jgi:hypothetical protein
LRGGIVGPGLLVPVLVAKFANPISLYRQTVIYAREGVELERAVLVNWVGAARALLRPLVYVIRRYVLAAAKLHADDTHKLNGAGPEAWLRHVLANRRAPRQSDRRLLALELCRAASLGLKNTPLPGGVMPSSINSTQSSRMVLTVRLRTHRGCITTQPPEVPTRLMHIFLPDLI